MRRPLEIWGRLTRGGGSDKGGYEARVTDTRTTRCDRHTNIHTHRGRPGFKAKAALYGSKGWRDLWCNIALLTPPSPLASINKYVSGQAACLWYDALSAVDADHFTGLLLSAYFCPSYIPLWWQSHVPSPLSPSPDTTLPSTPTHTQLPLILSPHHC